MSNGFTDDWLASHQAKIARQRSSGRPDLRLVTPSPDNRASQLPMGQRDAPGAKSRTKKNRPEEKLQIDVAEYLEYALPPPLRFWHTPNQRGTRAKFEARILKAMGVKPGIGDILIGGWRTLIWIELKSKTGRLEPEQKDWRDWCNSVGIPWFLCRSIDDVVEALESLQIRLLARLQ